MKKRFICILLCCVMLVGLLPTIALAEGTPSGTPLTQELIESKKGDTRDDGIQLPAGDYYLTDNAYLVGDDAGAWSLLLSSSGNFTLDLNGYVLDLRGANIFAFGNLTLKDSSTGGQPHKFRVEESGLWVWDETNGTKTVTGGVITGGVGTTMDGESFGGGVYVYSNLTMEGGSIVGCTASFGGGVYMMGGNSTFTMAGGHIVGCTAGKKGGGVDVDSNSGSRDTTKFTMEGGSIEDCTAANGGGVYTQSNTEFTMAGGSIQNCTAIETGGGVYGANTFTMKGGSIQNCTAANGGGVFVGAADTSTMTNGSIVGCTASFGGGVYVGDAGFTMTNGSIEDCTATQAGGGVFVVKEQNNRFTMDGGSISNCKVDGVPNAVHADGTFENNTGIEKSLLSGINGGQTGQANDPILIGSAEGLNDFRDKVNSGNADLCVRLLCDIVLNDGTFDENGSYTSGASGGIAKEWTPIDGYSGTFDGGGHTIKGLYVKVDGNAGLFSYIYQGTVKNVTVTGYVEGTKYVGGIVGDGQQTTINGCTNAATVKGGMSNIGGIVGYLGFGGNVRSCANLGSVRVQIDSDSQVAKVGGIVGHLYDDTTIADCYNAGSITIEDSGTGGYAVSYLGGIAGTSDQIQNMCYMSNCYSVGALTYRGSASAEIRGIFGDADRWTITNCYWLEETAESGIGGTWGQMVTNAEAKSKSDFADGTVLALLQNGDENSPWTKTGYLEAAKMMLPLLDGQTADEHVHNYVWQTENGQYWQACSECGYATEKKTVPEVSIIGADEACKTQKEYTFRFTLPEGASALYGYEFRLVGTGGLTPTSEDGVLYGVVPVGSSDLSADDSFRVVVYVTMADGFMFTVNKTVTLRSEHTGGMATCVEQAICEVCGERYGEPDATRHSDLTHVAAKAATKTAEGNIEYWYCSGCGKYYKDAAARREITKADTVTEKLKETSPKTGDVSTISAWIALFGLSCAALSILLVLRKRKASAK